MSDSTIQLFEEAVAALQRTAVTGHYKNGISNEQFADTIFQVAGELGSVVCNPIDENHLCFVISDGTPHIYEFPVNRIFRSLLGSIAGLIWSQSPETRGNQLFNPYADRREISYTNNNGLTMRFQVETANTNGKPLFFAIHKSQ